MHHSLAISRKKKHYFPVDTKYTKRKDSEFSKHKIRNKYHINNKSPIVDTGVGLVSQFVIDPMHNIYLGVVRRLPVKYLVDGKYPFKLRATTQFAIYSEMEVIKITYEFTRKIRTLSHI